TVWLVLHLPCRYNGQDCRLSHLESVSMSRLVPSCLVALLLAATLHAEEWPSWRGPRGDGTSSEKGVPLRFSPTDNVHWNVPIPGAGYRSQPLQGARTFLTPCLKDTLERVLFCPDRRSGKTLWRQTVLTAPLEQKHGLNSYASATPATDGQRVYVTFM